MPKIDGLTLLRRWREGTVSTPVLILTARRSWHEKVQGIDGGADDYMSKPFQVEEVLARIRALIRRASGNAKSEMRRGALLLDANTAPVSVAGVLSYLMHHHSRIVTRAELTAHIYV